MQYFAFILYSRSDRQWGDWLANRLDRYIVPEEYRGTELPGDTIVGKYIRPVFRHREPLTPSSHLNDKIHEAIRESQYLIVLCSPQAAKSEWVNRVVKSFILAGKGRSIRVAIVDGAPYASHHEQQCFPPALLDGIEPGAADLRETGDGRERAFVKIVAGMINGDYDGLRKRSTQMFGGDIVRKVISRFTPKRKIFISYRRADNPGLTGRIHDRLESSFGKGSVFMDVSSIPKGIDFSYFIRREIQNCGSFLLIIGKGWHNELPNLQRVGDFIRTEIKYALVYDLPMIPVLLEGARMPEIEELPGFCRRIAFTNAVRIGHDNFDAEARSLTKVIRHTRRVF
jgi:hypothetical protein